MVGDHFYTTSAAERDNAVRSFGYSSEGVTCNIFAQPRPPQTGDHAYTTSQTVFNEFIAEFGYRDEGIACYVLATGSAGVTPLYRLFNLLVWDNFYTTSAIERDTAETAYHYAYQEITCFVSATQIPQTQPLFRLRSTTTGDHFYTTSAPERDNAINHYNYVSEGIQCYVFTQPGPGRVPLLRLMKASDPWGSVPLLRLLGNGDHFYTTSQAESHAAIAHYGYHLEGIAGHIHDFDHPTTTTALFRLRSLKNGDHLYTISAFERDNAVANFNYVSEGITGWVYAPNIQSWVEATTPLYRLLAVSDPQTVSTGGLTCDGKQVNAQTQTFLFVAQDSVTKTIYQTNPWSVKANSPSNAQACAQLLVNAAISGATAVRLDSLKTFFFAMYSDGSCSTQQTTNTSSGDARTFLLFRICSNCTFADITASVTNPVDGSIDQQILDSWCDNNPGE
jgi:Repeat of unknown function (DUF5648)